MRRGRDMARRNKLWQVPLGPARFTHPPHLGGMVAFMALLAEPAYNAQARVILPAADSQ